MPRLPYLNEDNAPLMPATLAAVKARRKGGLVNLDRILAYSDPIIRGWNAMFGAIRSETALSPRTTEIAIIRVGIVLRAAYEVHQHSLVAMKLGMTKEELADLADWKDSKLFSAAERAVLDYADAMTMAIRVPDGVFATVRKHFDDRQIVELTTTIAGYNMVCRFLEAMQITLDGEER